MESFWSSKFLNTPGFVLSQIFRDSNLESEFGCDLLKNNYGLDYVLLLSGSFSVPGYVPQKKTITQTMFLAFDGVFLIFEYL